MYCLESKISKQVLLTRKPYCVPRIDDADLIRKLNAVNTPFSAKQNRLGMKNKIPFPNESRMDDLDILPLPEQWVPMKDL